MAENTGYGQEGFSDYEEQVNWDVVGQPIPIGEYDFEVVKAEYGQDKNKKHTVKVQFKVEAAYNAETFEAAKDRIVFENFGFTQQAGFRVKNFATATGVELPTLVSRTILEEWAGTIVGIKVGGQIKHRDWNDQKQSNVARFFPYQQGSSAQATVNDQQQQMDAAADPAQIEAEVEAAATGTVQQTLPGTTQPQQSLREAVNGTIKPAAKPPAAAAAPKAKAPAPVRR